MLIEIKDLSVRFGGLTVLDGINLNIKEGEFVSIVGPSGCGKTTLLNILGGVLDESNNTSIKGHLRYPSGRPRMAYSFQSHALLPWFTVARNVAIGAQLKGISKEKRNLLVDDLLEKVGLSGSNEVFPGQLSGGMRQRVALARILANDPDFLLMDEPFGALDAFTRIAMQELLSDLWHETNKTVVLVTHDLEEAITLGTRVILMAPKPSRIVQDFENDEFEAPRKPLELRSNKEFVGKVRQLWKIFKEENSVHEN